MEIVKVCDNVWNYDNGRGIDYDLTNETGEWFCSCADFQFRKSKAYGATCKHIKAVIDWEIERLEEEIKDLREQNGRQDVTILERGRG